MLIRGELWFSSPFDFNDPYDSNLPVDFALESYKKTEGFKTDEDFNVYNNSLTGSPGKFSLRLETLRKTVGVCCFSEVQDNLIMWSHYAENHKGVLLKFDVSELKKVFSKIHKVVYSNKIKQINYERSPENLLSKLLTKKSTHWKSEKEIRIIAKKCGHYSFPKSALKEIRFGLKCDNYQERDVIEIVRKFGYKDTSFTKVHTTNYDYKLSTAFITLSSEYKVYRPMGDQEIDINAIMKSLKNAE